MPASQPSPSRSRSSDGTPSSPLCDGYEEAYSPPSISNGATITLCCWGVTADNAASMRHCCTSRSLEESHRKRLAGGGSPFRRSRNRRRDGEGDQLVAERWNALHFRDVLVITMPAWQDIANRLGPSEAYLGIGLALNLRPKALLLFAAASLAITGAKVNADDTLIAIAVYTAVATSTVVAPTLATVFFPDRMETRLVASRDWITAHGPAVTGVVMVLIGLVVLGAGIAH